MGHPIGLLAMVLLMDQMPRNIYRNHARSFSFDWKAVTLTWQSIREKTFFTYTAMEKVWLLLVLTHAEDVTAQRICVELSTQELTSLDENWRKMWHGIFVKHLQVIEQFGRFPHRNRFL